MHRLVIAAVVAALAFTASAHAALNFDFSFSGSGSGGTVTGEIFGLADNTSNEAATDLVIDSYPAGLLLPATPWDIFNDAGYSISANAFTVSGGEITAADFEESADVGPSDFDLNQFSFANELHDTSSRANFVTNEDGFAGITFTANDSAIPEPASVAVLLSGLFALRMTRRRRG
jgi:hypothetical protein